MVERWNPYEIQLSCFMVLAVLSEIRECESLNPEGLALLDFREKIVNDPYGAFQNWNLNNSEPCLWLGVRCQNGKVQMLDLNGFSLQGKLSPALRNLRYMRSLVMSNNRISGSIPKEIGELKLLELLDLSHNNMTGTIPIQIGGMPSLKNLLLCGNNFEGDIPHTIEMLDYLFRYECNQRHKSTTQNRKYMKRISSCLGAKQNFCIFRTCGSSFCDNATRLVKDNIRRRLTGEPSNLVALPAKRPKVSQQSRPIVFRSGSLPTTITKSPLKVQTSNFQVPFTQQKTQYSSIKILIIIPLFVVLVATFFISFIGFRRHRGKRAMHNQNSALLHRISKVFVTGVPKLNSSELQTACEDFSNIIETFSGCLMYKGILSSGVEIAVLSTSIRSLKQWSIHAEREFKTKVDTFSKINHKNFVNLLGYCEEEDPFVRMMVFEYAPNGNLYEHLHVKDMDHLDWATRMRIIMGTCYCLEYMHHDLNPPVVHPNLQSDVIQLTDDYAAKVADVSFWGDIGVKEKTSCDEESEPLNSNQGPTCEDNVYNFGILLLEIISSKSFSMQAMEHLSDKNKYCNLVDPTLKSSKNDELEILCEVIKECVREDPRQRPTLKEITSKLKEVIKISQDAATSRVSPLWWAELEILSMESG